MTTQAKFWLAGAVIMAFLWGISGSTDALVIACTFLVMARLEGGK